ncbi:MAG: TolC family protein [Acidobacteria bacterium]|nr:TolC family protein [Acidobacteriota bacterium]
MLAAVLALVVSAGVQAPPVQAPAQTLTLAEAVARARRESPVRAGAAASAEGAEIAATLAGRRLNPLIDVRGENLAPRDPLVPDRDLFAVVSQPFELGGKRGVRRDIAGADRDVSHLVLRTVERQLALETVRAYMRAVRARDVLAILQTQRDGLTTIVATMRRRVEEGLAPESDLLRFEAEAARMATEMTRIQVELNRALMDLSALIGSPMPVAPTSLVSPNPVSPPAIGVDAIDRAVDQRPDLQLTAARVERARLSASLERLRRLPDPSVSAGYKRTQGQNTAVAGVVVAVPLFDQNAQARAIADAGVRAAVFDQQAAHARAVADAQAALNAAVALSGSLARVDRDLLAPAEGVRNAAQAMFREGASDVLKLVDAERIYADVRREAQSLAADAYVAAIEARFAVGEEDIP